MTDSASTSQPEISPLDRHLSAYDYVLPDDRIAQEPVSPRDSSKLLAVTSPTSHQHLVFRDLQHLLRPGDLLVLNNTRVIPARLIGRKPTGGEAEVLLVEELQRNRWLALVKPGRRLKPGATLEFDMPGLSAFAPDDGGSTTALEAGSAILTATVLSTDPDTNGRIIDFHLPDDMDIWDVLPKLGQVPLPPYVTNPNIDSERYQTVYSQRPGAIAAPTAGLHFTTELLAQLQAMQIDQAFITLHVGVGTFRPVEVEDITAHTIHSEWIDVPAHTVERINQVKQRGGRVIAVGTTVARALEAAAQSGTLQSFRGKTQLYIYPGYEWKAIDGLITNFHLPKSSLLMLVSALIGRERLLSLYEEAIAQDYRFYSFGDAMFIAPSACSFRTSAE